MLGISMARWLEEIGDIAADSDIVVACAKLDHKSYEELEQMVHGY